MGKTIRAAIGGLAVVMLSIVLGLGVSVGWRLPEGIFGPEEVEEAAAPAEVLAPEAAPEAEGSERVAASASPEAASEPPPRFDLVRVEPDGATLVAGRAAPGATVTILLDGDAVGQALTDAQGQFVTFVQAPPSDAPRVMSLSALKGAPPPRLSEETVLVLPAGAPSTGAGASVAEGASEAEEETGEIAALSADRSAPAAA
ncbi:MAG: hypothetical protein AAF676_08260 [Pseudomonadota bacterium]